MAKKGVKEEAKQFADFEQQITQSLLAGKTLSGKDGALTELVRFVVERAMQAEVDEHLAAQAALGRKDCRNGTDVKTIRTDFGPTELTTQRTRRAAEYQPQIVGKKQYDLAPNLSAQILSLYARGMSEGDVSTQLHELFGHQLSTSSISRVVQEVWPEVTAWQNRELQACYVGCFCDAIHFKIRSEGRTRSVAIYTVYGIDVDGQRDILLLEAGDGAESASQWSAWLVTLKERGVRDVFVICADGITGLDEVVAHHFPASVFQRCVVHIVRNCMVGVNHDDQKPLCAALRKVYRAGSLDKAAAALEAVRAEWGQRYPHVLRIWDRNWDAITAFLDFGPELRRLLYTTNSVENVHRQQRKVTKTKGSWPSSRSLLIQLYLGLQAGRKGWYTRVRGWPAIVRELIEVYGERYTRHL